MRAAFSAVGVVAALAYGAYASAKVYFNTCGKPAGGGAAGGVPAKDVDVVAHEVDGGKA